MRRRPHTDRRRGLLRAGLTAIGLIVLLLVAFEIVSSLTAPKAHAPAPTPPATPAAATPIPATATPSAKATTTPKKHKDVSMRTEHDLSAPASKQSPAHLLAALHGSGAALSARHGAYIATFSGIDPNRSSGTLVLRNTANGLEHTIGPANPYVHPVWSANGRSLLYVSSSETAAVPGVRWTLQEFDLPGAKVSTLARENALHLTPLGWWGGKPLYALATAADTSISTASGGKGRHLSILMPQILTSTRLSPGARFISFVAPTNCKDLCTLDIFDMSTLRVWVGPTGIPDARSLTWADDGKHIVAVLNGKLVSIDAASHATATYVPPAGFPLVWNHDLTAHLTNRGVTLIDQETNAVYRAGAGADL